MEFNLRKWRLLCFGDCCKTLSNHPEPQNFPAYKLFLKREEQNNARMFACFKL